MSDAITGLLGAVLMIIFILLIAVRVNEVPLWIVCGAALALMTWAFWEDDVQPLLDRHTS